MHPKRTIHILAIAALALLGAPISAGETNPAPLSDLVAKVDIPHDSFMLENGLTVLVHTDRKAPVVTISVTYAVGSKNEPKGKTGFAHLFEHLMFEGTENVPGDFFVPLQQVGATNMNGTTWFDRTNYYETVPTAALDLALMMESDRMGHLLGAVTQEALDRERAIVKNEKRQGDNAPLGLVGYELLKGLYPPGHPYHHSPIGSMADLDSATLADVKDWFEAHYGPNNAIIVLAGDIDVATAKAKIAHWFGDIRPGPKVKPVMAPVPTLAAPVTRTIKDDAATTHIYRMWAVPGLDNPDYLALKLAGTILGGLASSRLDDALVRRQKLAVAVSAEAQIFAQAGQFVVQADVAPGQDPARVAAALDAEIARLIAEGPGIDELQRASTSIAADQIRQLESTGGKAPRLASGLLYNGDPQHYRTELNRIAAMKPADVQAVTARWLNRPVFALIVEPGERTEGAEARAGFFTTDASGNHLVHADAQAIPVVPHPVANVASADRSKLPAVGDPTPLDFPIIERATLQNGISVFFAKRSEVPTVSVRISFDAGYAADPKSAPGTQSLLLKLMNEGTDGLDSSALAEERERLGALIALAADSDTTSFQLDAMLPNLSPSLGLLADIVRRPALSATVLERVRTQQLAAISAEMMDPRALASRVLVPTLYGEHPYGFPPSGLGDSRAIAALTRDDLMAFHARWFRPDNAQIFVVGATTLDTVVGMLNAAFGDWHPNRTARPVKNFSAAIPPQKGRVILVDRPGSSQSVIMAGQIINAKGTDDTLALGIANDILGGNYLGRINRNLRVDKGWTYGAYSGLTEPLDRGRFQVTAPVQTDSTGKAMAEIRREIDEFIGARGVSSDELDWSTKGSARSLPGMFETNDAVLFGVAEIVNCRRPDSFYETLASRYAKMTADAANAAFRSQISSDALVWIVVGDAAKVMLQVKSFGLPVEQVACLNSISPETCAG